MKRSVKKTRWNLIIILIIFGAISYAGLKYFMPAPQQADIFAIMPDQLTYGNTTVDGVIQKDAPAGEQGVYFLALPDFRHITLEITGIDNLLGLHVSVNGYLEPATENSPIKMLVTSVRVIK